MEGVVRFRDRTPDEMAVGFGKRLMMVAAEQIDDFLAWANEYLKADPAWRTVVVVEKDDDGTWKVMSGAFRRVDEAETIPYWIPQGN